MNILGRIESIRPFTEREAWWLFKAAALGEAVGWTVLISGIAINHYHLVGQNIAIPIAGQIHGSLFVIYFGVLIASYSSLRWPRYKFLIAILAGIPPYGSLVFERWASRKRRNKHLEAYFFSIMLSSIVNPN